MAEKLNGLEKFRQEQKEKKEAEKLPKEEKQMETEKPKGKSSYKVINGIEVNPEKDYHFETIVKSPARRHIVIGAVNKIYDTDLNQPRNIRYVPTASTIFEDELTDSYKTLMEQHVGFYGNELTVSGDVRLVEYLLSHDDFDGNPKRLNKLPAVFTLANKELLEAKKSEQFSKEEMALDVINKSPEDKLRPIARIVFNITDDDFSHIKNRLKEIVKKEKFGKTGKSGADMILDNVDNPKLEIKFVIQKAMDKGIISINPDKGSAVWSDLKTFIAPIKNVKDSARQVEELTDYSLTKEGQKFFELLKDKV